MIANSNIKPDSILKYGITGTGQINYLLERNDKTDEQGNSFESWDYLSTFFDSLDRLSLIHAVIREKYNEQDELDMLHDYLNGSDLESYKEFQKWRIASNWIVDQILSGHEVLKTDYEAMIANISN